MSSSHRPATTMDPFDANVLAILVVGDREKRPPHWRKEPGRVAVGLAISLVLIGAGVALHDELRSDHAPPAAGASRTADVAITTNRTPVSNLTPIGTNASQSNVHEATLPTTSDARGVSIASSADQVARQRKLSSDGVAKITSPHDESSSTRQVGRPRRRPGPGRRFPRSARLKSRGTGSLDASIPNLNEATPDKASTVKRSVIETRDALRDLRLK